MFISIYLSGHSNSPQTVVQEKLQIVFFSTFELCFFFIRFQGHRQRGARGTMAPLDFRRRPMLHPSILRLSLKLRTFCEDFKICTPRFECITVTLDSMIFSIPIPAWPPQNIKNSTCQIGKGVGVDRKDRRKKVCEIKKPRPRWFQNLWLEREVRFFCGDGWGISQWCR